MRTVRVRTTGMIGIMAEEGWSDVDDNTVWLMLVDDGRDPSDPNHHRPVLECPEGTVVNGAELGYDGLGKPRLERREVNKPRGMTPVDLLRLENLQVDIPEAGAGTIRRESEQDNLASVESILSAPPPVDPAHHDGPMRGRSLAHVKLTRGLWRSVEESPYGWRFLTSPIETSASPAPVGLAEILEVQFEVAGDRLELPYHHFDPAAQNPGPEPGKIELDFTSVPAGHDVVLWVKNLLPSYVEDQTPQPYPRIDFSFWHCYKLLRDHESMAEKPIPHRIEQYSAVAATASGPFCPPVDVGQRRRGG